jgi:hypothetical protein
MKYLLSMYLWIFRLFELFRNIFYKIITRYVLIYYYDGTTITNITLRYFLGLSMEKYSSGVYYVKCSDKNYRNLIGIYGTLADLKYVINIKNFPRTRVLKKDILFYNNDKMINVELADLENYYHNTKIENIVPVTNLGMILKFMGKKCSMIKIIKLFPYQETIEDPNEFDINNIYY